MSQHQPYMEKPLLTPWVILYIGWYVALGKLQGRSNSFIMVDGVSDMAVTCWLNGRV